MINATSGTVSLEALTAGRRAESPRQDPDRHLESARLLQGHAAHADGVQTDSVGEQIQRAFPDAKVVKTLNTTNVNVMVDPGQVAGGDHDLFVSGNDAGAKARVTELLRQWFGWRTSSTWATSRRRVAPR